MKFFKNFSIRNKILSGFVAVLLICAISIVISYTTITGQIKQFENFVNQTVHNLDLVKDIRFEDLTLTDCVRGIIINPNSDGDRKLYNDYAALIDQKINEAKAIATSDEEKKLFDENDTYNKKLVELETEMMDVNTDRNQVLSIFNGEYASYRKLFADNLNKFELIQQNYMNSTSKSIKGDMNKKAVLILVFFGISILLGVIVSMFIANIIGRPVKNLVEAADRLAVGDINVKVESTTKDEIGNLMESFDRMIQNIHGQAEAANKIAAGDLSVSLAVKSEGDILSKSLNHVVHTLNDLISEMDKMSKQHDIGEIDDFVPEERFGGAYKTMAQGVNDMVKGHITVKKKAMACVAEFSKGNFDAELEKFPGKKAFINENIEGMRKNLKNVNAEINNLINASINGELRSRADDRAFTGDWAVLIKGLNNLLEAIIAPINEAAAVLNEMEKANLQVQVEGNYKGDHAIIKNAINNAINSFNEVLGNINSASNQVASGSRQVSASSQALSQGSTEQASSIEEITASMEEVASQTKQNATNANQANGLASTAKEKAVQGNMQMAEMLKAMAEINDSSSNISKIIKVIDEIAFQTNILALNAAVEAARAGQHGKGFAVVAEEVRNLAARSANAAKETTMMIEGSIRKVDAGTKIANDTAAALNQIVGDVARAADLVGKIAEASNEQASGIAQINQAIAQVAQVVQTNSATSEEGAAASEELSSQAELLKELVNKYKLGKNVSYKSGVEALPSEVLKMLEDVAAKKHLPRKEESYSEASVAKTKIILDDNDYGKY